VAFAEKLKPHSFEPPFADVDHSGQRIVNRQWRTSGSTKVLGNYVRLTPDRQSKQGALWARKSLSVSEMSAVLKFRISGQGKHFFGDGLALWIVQQGYYSEGPLHGFHEKFVGVGIIFDTFRNTENIEAHRDVTILVNDGEKTYAQMTEQVQGCDTNVRYHADRADFSVADSSRAKIVIKGGYLAISVDEKNTDEWSNCANVSLHSLDENWLKRAHIGLTATTGQLADNHDVISLVSYSDQSVMEEKLEEEKATKLFNLGDYRTTEEKLQAFEKTFNAILNTMEFFDHHIEHEVVGLTDAVQSVTSRLEELRDEPQIKNLDEVVQRRIDDSFQSKVSKTEKRLTENFEKKMAVTQKAIDRLKAAKPSGGGDGSYMVPFYCLLVVVIGMFGGALILYQKMVNKWKLP
jgi:mannose-binding lectin 2